MKIDDIFERKLEDLIYDIYPYNRLSKNGKENLILWAKNQFVCDFIQKLASENYEFKMNRKLIDEFEQEKI